MKKVLFAAAIVTLTIISCKGKDEKKNETPAETTTTTSTTTESTSNNTGDDAILSLDVSTLKDEAGFLKTWEEFTKARVADEKKREADKNYEGHYLDYLKMYTKLLTATTAFTKTIKPASAAVAFSEKVSAIQNKM